MRYEFDNSGDGKTRITLSANIVTPFNVPAWLVRNNFPEWPADILHKLTRLAAGTPSLSQEGAP